MELAESSREVIVNANMNILDSGVAVLGSTNTFTALQTFNAGINTTTILASGQIGGNNTALTLGRAQITYASNADVTLSAAQYSNVVIEVQSGAFPSAGVNLIFPGTVWGIWWVRNLSAQIVTCKTASGTGPAIAASRGAWCGCGGSNVIRMTADSVFT
jgi:hypothetical protein